MIDTSTLFEKQADEASRGLMALLRTARADGIPDWELQKALKDFMAFGLSAFFLRALHHGVAAEDAKAYLLSEMKRVGINTEE